MNIKVLLLFRLYCRVLIGLPVLLSVHIDEDVHVLWFWLITVRAFLTAGLEWLFLIHMFSIAFLLNLGWLLEQLPLMAVVMSRYSIVIVINVHLLQEFRCS